jgi:nucleoside-diphosphate-sugar epimerase
MILQTIKYCKSPAMPINITGPELLSIRETAQKFGELMNKKVSFSGTENETALLGNAELSFKLFGKPKISVDKVIEWTAKWISENKKLLGKPTHFEVRDGKY